MKKIFLMAFAFLFAISLLGVSSTQAKVVSPEYSFSGKVVAVDFLGQNMTVKATGASPTFSIIPGSEVTFNVDEKTHVTMCNQPRTLDNISVGDRVTVKYNEERHMFFAKSIDLKAPFVACLVE